jgi:hypothetical protein
MLAWGTCRVHSEYQNEDENDNKSPDNQPIHKLNTHNFTSVETFAVQRSIIEAGMLLHDRRLLKEWRLVKEVKI